MTEKLSGVQKDELMQQVQQQLAVANFQELVTVRNENLFSLFCCSLCYQLTNDSHLHACTFSSVLFYFPESYPQMLQNVHSKTRIVTEQL